MACPCLPRRCARSSVLCRVPQLPAVQAAAVAATGFVAGAATVVAIGQPRVEALSHAGGSAAASATRDRR